jgi:hypothetical protein
MKDWRRDTVTPRQLELLHKLGLPIPTTKGEASDLLSSHFDKPTPKQVAKLEYMGFKVPRTKEKVSDLLDKIEEDPEYEEKRVNWDIEKYDLHPDLYTETGEEYEKRLEQKIKTEEHQNKFFQYASMAVFVFFIGTLSGNAIWTRLFVFSVVFGLVGTICYFCWKKKSDDQLGGFAIINCVLFPSIGAFFKNVICTRLLIFSAVFGLAGAIFYFWKKTKEAKEPSSAASFTEE